MYNTQCSLTLGKDHKVLMRDFVRHLRNSQVDLIIDRSWADKGEDGPERVRHVTMALEQAQVVGQFEAAGREQLIDNLLQQFLGQPQSPLEKTSLTGASCTKALLERGTIYRCKKKVTYLETKPRRWLQL